MGEKISQKELATRLDVDPAYINRLVKSGRLPYTNKRLDYEECLEILGKEVVKKQETDNTSSADIDKQFRAARAAKETYTAKLTELELKQKEKELFPVDLIKEMNEKIAVSIRTKFLSLPSKVAPSLEGLTVPEIQDILDGEVNNILSELYHMGGGFIDG